MQKCPQWSPLQSVEARSLITFKLTFARLGTRFRAEVLLQMESLISLTDVRLGVLEGWP